MNIAKKKTNPITLMAEIAIMAAAGFVLDELSGAMFKGIFVNGGSIGIAMVTVALMCYRRGPIAGLAVGFIVGIFDLLTGPYMVASSPWKVVIQVLLDYVLAYPLVALCAVFKPAFDKAETKDRKLLFLLLGVGLGTLGKLLCHFLAGVLFWADPNLFAWGLTDMNPVLYCFIYNAAFAIPSGIVSGIVMALMLQKAPQLYLVGNLHDAKPIIRKSLNKEEKIGLLAMVGVSAGIFAYFMYRYIASYYYGDYGADGSEISFDADSLVAWIAAALVILFAVIALLAGEKGKYRSFSFPYQMVFIGGFVSVYGLARLIRALIKGKDPFIYYFWIAGGLLFIALLTASILVYKRKKEKEIPPKEEETSF